MKERLEGQRQLLQSINQSLICKVKAAKKSSMVESTGKKKGVVVLKGWEDGRLTRRLETTLQNATATTNSVDMPHNSFTPIFPASRTSEFLSQKRCHNATSQQASFTILLSHNHHFTTLTTRHWHGDINAHQSRKNTSKRKALLTSTIILRLFQSCQTEQEMDLSKALLSILPGPGAVLTWSFELNVLLS